VTTETQLVRGRADEMSEPIRNDGDIRATLMTMPADQMAGVLTEYDQRRTTFRKWLLDNMTEGVHYGFPPGIEPKYDGKGNIVNKKWDKRSNGWVETSHSPKSYKPKHSLYKPGAQLVCDLLNLVPVFDADQVSWQMMGSPQGMFVMRCRLYPKGQPHIDETLKGEGRGIREVGQKGGDANNAIKMAEKTAQVDAVINGLGLSDLFTQDTEEIQKGPPTQAPEPRQGGPVAVERAKRVSGDDLMKLLHYWKETMDAYGRDQSDKAFREFIVANGGPTENPNQASRWSIEQLAAVRAAVDGLRGEG